MTYNDVNISWVNDVFGAKYSHHQLLCLPLLNNVLQSRYYLLQCFEDGTTDWG